MKNTLFYYINITLSMSTSHSERMVLRSEIKESLHKVYGIDDEYITVDEGTMLSYKAAFGTPNICFLVADSIKKIVQKHDGGTTIVSFQIESEYENFLMLLEFRFLGDETAMLFELQRNRIILNGITESELQLKSEQNDRHLYRVYTTQEWNTLIKYMPRLQKRVDDSCFTGRCDLTEEEIKKVDKLVIAKNPTDSFIAYCLLWGFFFDFEEICGVKTDDIEEIKIQNV